MFILIVQVALNGVFSISVCVCLLNVLLEPEYTHCVCVSKQVPMFIVALEYQH